MAGPASLAGEWQKSVCGTVKSWTTYRPQDFGGKQMYNNSTVFERYTTLYYLAQVARAGRGVVFPPLGSDRVNEDWCISVVKCNSIVYVVVNSLCGSLQ